MHMCVCVCYLEDYVMDIVEKEELSSALPMLARAPLYRAGDEDVES